MSEKQAPLGDPEIAVEILKLRVAELEQALRRLADQDATLSVCGGAVTVTMDATLTVAEREFLQALHNAYEESANQTGYVNAAAQADSRKNAAIIRGLLERLK